MGWSRVWPQSAGHFPARAIAALICRSPASVGTYIEFARADVVALLAEHAGIVLDIASALLAHRTLNGAEIDAIITDCSPIG